MFIFKQKFKKNRKKETLGIKHKRKSIILMREGMGQGTYRFIFKENDDRK